MPTDIPAADLARWAALVEQSTALDAEHAAMFNEWAGTPNEIALCEERDNARLAMAEQFPALLAGYAAKVAECDELTEDVDLRDHQLRDRDAHIHRLERQRNEAERVVGQLEAALRRWDLTASDAGECDCPSCDANRAALASAAAWRKGR